MKIMAWSFGVRVSWHTVVAAGVVLVVLVIAAACDSGSPGATGTTATTTGIRTSASSSSQSEVEKGKQLFTQFTCSTCHNTATTQPLVGPSMKGLYGAPVKLDNGMTITADDAYIRESILKPDAKTVEGFPKGLMSASISDEENKIQEDGNLDALVAYIESLK